MWKPTIALILSMTAVIALSGCEEGAQSPTTKEMVTYKVGVISPVTGDAAAYGVEVQRVLDYRIKELNSEAALKGYQIDLVFEDGKCDGGASVTALQKLTDVEGIDFILGGLCSSESLGIAPLLEDKNVVALSGWSSNPDIEGASPNLFSLSYSDALVGQGVARELGEFSKIALISEQNDYNQGLKKVVTETLEQENPDVEIVLSEAFSKGGTDFRNQLTKLKNSGAEAIFLNPNAGVTAQSLVKQVGEIEGWDVQLISQFALFTEDVLSHAPEAMEGLIIIDAPSLSSNELGTYMDEVIAQNGSLDALGVYYSASSIDALDILSELIHEHKGDVKKVRESLATRSFSGWLGSDLRFNGNSFVQGIGVTKYVVEGGVANIQ